MVNANMIGVPELARRFGKSTRWATKVIRRMRHLPCGKELFTTEEWLAEWLAARSIPQNGFMSGYSFMDPLEEFCMNKVIQMMGEMARKGLIEVKRCEPVKVGG